jgi:oligoendopeptidase F
MDLCKKNIKFSLEDAKSIIFDSLGIFGEEYVNNLKRAFKEK